MPLGISRRTLLTRVAGLPLFAVPRFAAAAAPTTPKSPVALVKGESRKQNVLDALQLIDAEVRQKLQGRSSVIIKPNLVSTNRQLAATHADAIRGAIEYLAPRFKGPIVIAESSAGNTFTGYENFFYNRIVTDYPAQKVSLVDLNEEGKYEILQILDADLHITPVRLGARLLDPDAFVMNIGPVKTHNTVVATLSIKNMAMGAPLHSHRKETTRWNDKRAYHGGVRQTHYDLMLTAQRLHHNWGATVLDGFEGMEGNGPGGGTPVPSRMAIASTDFVAADRITVEAMGINPEWMGYLQYCAQAGVGQFEREQIELRGEKVESVRRTYQLHNDIERMLQWMGPMKELPPRLG